MDVKMFMWQNIIFIIYGSFWVFDIHKYSCYNQKKTKCYFLKSVN